MSDERQDERPWIQRRRPPSAADELAHEQKARLSFARLSVAQTVGASILIALMCIGTVYVAFRFRPSAVPEPPEPFAPVQQVEQTPASPVSPVPPQGQAIPPPISTEISAPLKKIIRWQYDADVFDIKRPALGPDGSLYFCRNKVLTGLANDGSVRWEFTPPGEGWVTAPAINTDQNIVTTAGGTVYSVNGWGEVDWSCETGHYSLNECCTTSRGMILTTSLGGMLYCLYPRGGVCWEVDLGSPIKRGPAFGNQIFTVSKDGTLHAVSLSGKLVWEVDNLPLTWERAPVVGTDGTVYVTSYEPRTVYAFSAQGKMLWEFPAGRIGYIDLTPCRNGDILITGSGGVQRVDRHGAQLWSIKRGRADPNPVLETRSGHFLLSGLNENVVEFINPDGTHYLGLNLPLESLNYALEANDGSIYICMLSGKIYAIKLPSGTG